MAQEQAHSRFGGSKADRWMNCAASTSLCAKVPESASSSYADEGTFAHQLAEDCLRVWADGAFLRAETRIGTEVHSPKLASKKIVTAEMAAAVQVYLDAVAEELQSSPGAELYIEERFSLPIKNAFDADIFGSNDAMVWHPTTKRLVIFDYKHGVGVSVTAEDNSQLKFYACGAMLTHPEWGVTDIELVIAQPRARDADEIGAVRRWPMDVLQVLTFMSDADNAIKQAWKAAVRQNDPSEYLPHFAIGSWCRWCSAAAICPAKEQAALKAATLDFESVVDVTREALPDVATLDMERLSKIVAGAALISEFAQRAMELIEARLMAGDAVPGWKVVEKIGRRKWVAPEEQIAGTLGFLHGISEDDIRPRSLVTITEATKLLKLKIPDKIEQKKAIDDMEMAFTLKESSGLTIAPESDKRAPVDAVASAFGQVEV